jgi:Fur family ferric uptake transcriptional regulator
VGELRSRSTRQRVALLGLLGEVPNFLSAQELYARLQAQGVGLGLPAVYRALHDFTDQGVVDVSHTGGGEAVYRRCGSPKHHHHLVCRQCGRAVEVSASSVERWARSLGATYGFSDIRHQVEVSGVCPGCDAVSASLS